MGNVKAERDDGKHGLCLFPGCRVSLLIGLFLIAAEFLFFYYRNSAAMVYIASLLLLNNLAFSVKDFPKRFPFTVFLVCFFTFLLSRPLIEAVRGHDIAEYQVKAYLHSTKEGVYVELLLIALSLFFLLLGALAAEQYEKGKARSGTKELSRIEDCASRKTYVRRFCLPVFCISYILSFLLKLEQLNFIINNSYVEYYAKFESAAPYILYVLSTFCPFSLTLLLISDPGKKLTSLLCGLYILLGIPMLIGGGRSEFVLSLLFVATYYLWRSGWKRKLSPHIIALAVLCGVTGVIGLNVLSYFRKGESITLNHPFSVFVGFFFSQGVTFSWSCVCISQAEQLKALPHISYTFGPFLDYILHNKLAQLLFGAVPLNVGNSIEAITVGNNLAPYLSYINFGELFFEGHGTGSSYLLELYLDFGTAGVIVFNLLLGFVLWNAYEWADRKWGFALVFFSAYSGLLFMPRANVLSPFTFAWRIPFLLLLVSLVVFRKAVLYAKHKATGDKEQPKPTSNILTSNILIWIVDYFGCESCNMEE